MKRFMLGFLIGVYVGATARRNARRKFSGAMEQMAERVMPQMMDSWFAQMSADRRTFMFAHCRETLDHIEAKYGAAPTTMDRAGVA
jgi:hypothetical protein